MLQRPVICALVAAALLLTAVAWLRGAEYDEQYTLFVTSGVPRPVWPTGVITAAEVRALQAGQSGFAAIARDLRATDVHPPLYFWLLSVWRTLAGSSLFAARMASVLLSVVTLSLIAAIARAARIPVVPAVLMTVGCYGFAYTASIARGFALAQTLSVAGIALLTGGSRRPGRMLLSGMLFGAATFSNFLAGFVGCAALLAITIAARPAQCRLRSLTVTSGPALLGFAAWLPADLWFFLAQRQSRQGQFDAFEPASAILRLAQYSAAALFGGLPRYVDERFRTIVSTAVMLLLFAVVVVIIRRWRRLATPDMRLLLAMCAAAPPIGLLLLGVMFDSTPIELRYLAFAIPFVGLLLAAALPRGIRNLVLAVQAVALIGLMTRAETMQPARAAARAAASLVGKGVVLLPHGNDGVGIVGAFANEAPASMRLLVIDDGLSPAEIRARASGYPSVVLALLGQDRSSRATLPAMRKAFTDPCWRAAGEGADVAAFERICDAR